MFLLETRKLTSELFTFALILIIGELSIRQTSATFYVEVTDKNANHAKITLYECNQEGTDPISPNQSPERPTRQTSIRSISTTYNDDVTCKEVKDKRKKKNIYSMANFYMVVDTMLDGGKRIYVLTNGKKGSLSRLMLGLASSNMSILVGVIIMKQVNDMPVFRDVRNDKNSLDFIYSECKKTPIIRSLADDKLKEVVLYLSMANYSLVIKPKKEDISRFKVFGEVVKEIEAIYNRDVRLATQTNFGQQLKKEIEGDVLLAVRLLISKLIDPCLFLAGIGEHDAQKRVFAINTAETQCKNYCKFLAVGFKSNGVTSSKCNGNRDSLVSGTCYIYRCFCKMQTYMFGLPEPEKYYSMIECSNDLRIKTAAVTLKTPLLASSSSIRQSFRRSFPASLWRSRSNGNKQ